MLCGCIRPLNESSRISEDLRPIAMTKQSVQEYRKAVASDLFRYAGALGCMTFFQTFRTEAGFRLTFWLRTVQFLGSSRNWILGGHRLAAWFYHRNCVRCAVQISLHASIGRGLYLPHALCIVVHGDCVIGENCTLSHGVTLGSSPRDEGAKVPRVGDRVFFGPGAVAFGAITIDDDSAIGANCVVTKNVPQNATVVGVPGKIVSFQGSHGCIKKVMQEYE
jgi:serine O-acetyltransferase